uniref:Uncharacterized protein n=1 Tax=Octopus bimaculoides TaxID=37653 RepID=A0A0L8HFV9_OCTBM
MMIFRFRFISLSCSCLHIIHQFSISVLDRLHVYSPMFSGDLAVAEQDQPVVNFTLFWNLHNTALLKISLSLTSLYKILNILL